MEDPYGGYDGRRGRHDTSGYPFGGFALNRRGGNGMSTGPYDVGRGNGTEDPYSGGYNGRIQETLHYEREQLRALGLTRRPCGGW